MNEEEWLELPAAPDRYLVSTHGRLFSLTRKRIMKKSIQGGVLAWSIWTPQLKVRAIPVAATVLATFVQEKPTRSHTPDYLDGDRTNCSTANLTWQLRDYGAARRGRSHVPRQRVVSPDGWREQQRELRRQEIAERDYSTRAFLPAVKTG